MARLPWASEDKETWLKVRGAFRHLQEIVEETKLQSRLNVQTQQELRNLVEPLIRNGFLGEVKAPSYTVPVTITRIYYQIADHEARNILQEYIIDAIHRDLHSKGVNTRWVDQVMELLATTDNQHVIATWTNNSIDLTTAISKLARIRQELKYEQTGELIIITPWKRDAKKLRDLVAQINQPGVVVMHFSEDETDKLANHITDRTALRPRSEPKSRRRDAARRDA